MLVEDAKRLEPVERLSYWVRERHAVYLRKRRGDPPPWTDDEILRRHYFTNPYREHDKTTAWLRTKIRDPWADDPEVLWAVLCFRWFNWIPTGEALLKAGLLRRWDGRRAVRLLGALKAGGAQVFTGAFNISNSGSTKPKINRVCEDYLDPVWHDLARLLRDAAGWRTLAQAHERLYAYLGLGGSGFMAAQVVADLKYTGLLRRATDWWTWCSPGPGSVKGLALALGRRPIDFIEDVNLLRRRLRRSCPGLPPLHAQDVQNCLCEFFKYDRALAGGGSKRRYNGLRS